MIRNAISLIVFVLLSVGYIIGSHYYDRDGDYIELLFQVLLILFLILSRYFFRNQYIRLSSNINSKQAYFFGVLAIFYLILGIVGNYRGDRIFGVYNSNIGFSVLFFIVAYLKRKKELLITPKGVLFYDNNKLVFDNEDFYQIAEESLIIKNPNHIITININHLNRSQKNRLLNNLKSVKIST